MRRILFILLLSGVCIAAYNQTIRGTIFDKDTKAIINFASLYFNGTVTGTSTDSKGNFELNISKYSKMPLTISAIGYYSETITDFSSTKPYTIFLSPKVFELSEVVISSKAHDRERKYNMKLFRNEFLGATDDQHRQLVNRQAAFRGSRMHFFKNSVYFDKNGYYDPTGISWEGEMARYRIADELPLEYSLTNK